MGTLLIGRLAGVALASTLFGCTPSSILIADRPGVTNPAASADAGNAAVADDAICGPVRRMAEVVMTMRQQGLPMQTAMKEVARGSDNKFVRTLGTILVEQAYEEPRWGSQVRRESAVAAFADASSKKCSTAVEKP